MNSFFFFLNEKLKYHLFCINKIPTNEKICNNYFLIHCTNDLIK